MGNFSEYDKAHAKFEKELKRDKKIFLILAICITLGVPLFFFGTELLFPVTCTKGYSKITEIGTCSIIGTCPVKYSNNTYGYKFNPMIGQRACLGEGRVFYKDKAKYE